MFFWTAKILWTLLSPLHLIALVMLAGLVLMSFGRGAGRFLLGAGATLFLFLGFIPVGPNLMAWLEMRYERPNLPPGVDGIIVLGGATNPHVSERTGQISVNSNFDRMIAFVDLARRYPEARAVFSGGSGHILQPKRTEADDARAYLETIGFPADRVIFESRSRNTYENAVYAKQQAQPQPGEIWVLITSASHMRRAVAVFEKAGWDVVPYPVDSQTTLDYDWQAWPLGFVRNYADLERAMKEIIGYYIYAATGKSDWS